MTFRLVVQPIMAAMFAARAAWKHEGWTDVPRLCVFAFAVDVVYQLVALHWVYPGQAAIVAAALALVPYAMVRVISGAALRWRRRT